MNDLTERHIQQLECRRRQRVCKKPEQQRSPTVGSSENAQAGDHENQKRDQRKEEIVRELSRAAEDVILEDCRPNTFRCIFHGYAA